MKTIVAMRITAVLAIRDEEYYLANCLRHLVRSGVDFVIIDNGSSDKSAEIYRRREFSKGLVDVQELPFTGAFSLGDQLRKKMDVIGRLETDWVLHVDADEEMHSNVEGEPLNQALSRLEAQGWNVVNFDEFVFLPIECDYIPEAGGNQPILHYYFFQPFSPRLMRAWKKSNGFSLVEHGGHLLTGADLRLAPENLVLRHYIVRSQDHAFHKYIERKFAADEVAGGSHIHRINQPLESFVFPPAKSLRKVSAPEDCHMDRSDPWKVHYWRLGVA